MEKVTNCNFSNKITMGINIMFHKHNVYET